MSAITIRRIRFADPDGGERIAALLSRLSMQGDIVSPRGREITERVFGQPLTPVQVVERVCEDVRQRGLPALLHYTEQFDAAKITPETLRVSQVELEAAHAAADPAFLETLRRVRQSVMSFQLGLLHGDAVLSVPGQHELRLRYKPMRRVGICVPGGAAAYPSTLLMTVCPARAAGVKELVVVMPPSRYARTTRIFWRPATSWESPRSIAWAAHRQWRRSPMAWKD